MAKDIIQTSLVIYTLANIYSTEVYMFYNKKLYYILKNHEGFVLTHNRISEIIREYDAKLKEVKKWNL